MRSATRGLCVPMLAGALLVTVLLPGPRSVAAPVPGMVPGPAQAGRIDAGLRAKMAAAAPDELLPATIVLSKQADLGPALGRPRAKRLRAVEHRLRAAADAGQAGLLDLLRQRRAQGAAADVVPLWVLDAVSVRATKAVLAQVAARPDVAVVQAVSTVRAPVPAVAAATTSAAGPESNVAAVNAPAMWDRGFRGQGVVVASMDTGVDATHPDLAARWRGGSNSWYDPNGQHPTTPTDVNGHGTQVMGVMVGGDAGGTSIGVAPDARWIAVKIFDDRGVATSTGIHLGFQWLLDPDGDPSTADAPNVVNDSWTMSPGGCSLDFQSDLRTLRAAGILPVFAAGNYGPTANTVPSPANNPEAFAVGDTDDQDVVDPSSSRGPSACTGAVAPAVTAPGVGIRTTDLYGGYVDETGTSMAAPHVAGVLALMLSALPGLSADRQQQALEAGAADLGPTGLDNDYGYGRVDALRAYQWANTAPDYSITVAPTSATTLPGGTADYDVTVTRVNGFADDVALSLSGLTSSQATWSFSPATVTGGSGTAHLTLSAAPTLPAGSYPFSVTGLSGGQQRTAAATLVVQPAPDFTLAATPTTQAVPAGSTATYSVSVGALAGFSGSVALSASGLPSNVGSATLTPASVTGSGTAQLAVQVPATAPGGTYQLTVTGTSGATSHAAVVALSVVARDFAVSASPGAVTVARGKVATYTVTVTGSGGFTGPVKLSVTGLPAGATGSWTQNPVIGSGATTLKVRTTGSVRRGTYTLRIAGTSGTLTRRTSATLVVR